jgi:GT2 family glycosyltransferase
MRVASASRVTPSAVGAPNAPRLRVAIAVPSLDQGRFLGQALDSLFAQSEVDLRVAVLDGGSRDESLAVIGRYECRLAYWRASPDRGQAAAINEGIAQFRDADYVGWLNADDVLLPSALLRMAAYLDAHPECVAAFGQAHIIDADGRIIGQFPTRPFTRRALARTSIICQPASLISRRAWEAVGGLDESLHMCLDYDLWWRLSNLGPVGYIRQFVACSRDHEATKTRAHQDRLYPEAFSVLQRHLGYVPWSWCLSEAAYAWRAAHGGERAAGFLSQFTCGSRAAHRHARVNGLAGLINGLRQLWLRRG